MAAVEDDGAGVLLGGHAANPEGAGARVPSGPYSYGCTLSASAVGLTIDLNEAEDDANECSELADVLVSSVDAGAAVDVCCAPANDRAATLPSKRRVDPSLVDFAAAGASMAVPIEDGGRGKRACITST